jgi:hypothetical protein
MDTDILNDLLRDAVTTSFRNNLLNLYQSNGSRRRSNLSLSTRYYNEPPIGGYQVTEEEEYDIDYDDLSALIFLDVTTRFASPVSEDFKNLRNSKIKEIKYKKVKECSDTECAICLDTVKVGEFEKTLECKHTFHKKCIDRWFKKDNDSCPMCRLKVIKLN